MFLSGAGVKPDVPAGLFFSSSATPLGSSLSLATRFFSCQPTCSRKHANTQGLTAMPRSLEASRMNVWHELCTRLCEVVRAGRPLPQSVGSLGSLHHLRGSCETSLLETRSTTFEAKNHNLIHTCTKIYIYKVLSLKITSKGCDCKKL